MVQSERVSDFMNRNLDQVEGSIPFGIPDLPRLGAIKLHIARDSGRIHIVRKVGLGQRPIGPIDRSEREIELLVQARSICFGKVDTRNFRPCVQSGLDGRLDLRSAQPNRGVGNVVRQIGRAFSWPIPPRAGHRHAASFIQSLETNGSRGRTLFHSHV